jgi:methyl-accepting chemotaxis protein
MKLRTKLSLAFLLIGIVPFTIVSLTLTLKSKAALEKEAIGKLEAVRQIKKTQLQNFFSERKADVDIMVKTVEKVRDEAFHKLVSVQRLKMNQIEQFFDKVHNDLTVLSQSAAVQSAYKQFETYYETWNFGPTNPYELEKGSYNFIWEKFKTSLGNYVSKFGYEDIYIICKSHGHVMYSFARKNDLGTNLGHGPYKEEGLAKLWNKVIERDRIVIQDFSAYSPSQDNESMFIGGPIKNFEGETFGIVVLQVSSEKINNIVQQREGLGSTGETYLASREEDRIEFRSNMQTMGNGEYVVGYNFTEIAPKYIKQTLQGDEINDVYTDSDGNPVIVSTDPLHIGKGITWAMVTRQNLEEALVSTLYNGQEKKDFFKEFIGIKGYKDLFLINENGFVYYSSAKESDYHTNLMDGKYSDSGLGKLTRKVFRTKEYEVQDFEPYPPSNGNPAAFIAKPIQKNGHVETIVAMKLSMISINEVMQERQGMGETGETYLVGQDNLMRSNSYLDPEGHSVEASFAGNIQNNGVDSLALSKALAGKTGISVIDNYIGNKVLSAFTPFQVSDDLTWALLAEVNETEAFASVNNMKWWIVILAALAIVSIIVVALIITINITKPINRIINGLIKGAAQVTSASNQVSSTSQSLAEGSSEQASSLEETTSSLEEITSQTKQNADNASQADTTMKEAGQVVESGVQSMERMLKAIEDISNSSTETYRIIKTIDEIAFQTNLLALNAAVEAARAGESGKGFAVVAEEVRSLAQRSSEAVKNTTELIEKSRESTENGVSVAKEMSTNLGQIKEHAQKMSIFLSEISSGSKEQSQGLDQVNKAVSQMDELTQEHASNAEESASAAEELESQAQEMENMVDELVAIVGQSKSAKSVNGFQEKKNKQANKYRASQSYAQEQSPGSSYSSENKSGRRNKDKPILKDYRSSKKKLDRDKSVDQVIPLDEDEFSDF